MSKTLNLIFCKGLPGSGKSTWALEYCKKNHGWIRVNRDDIRASRGQYWIPEQEDYITAVERFMVQDALLKGYNVIVDAMNINIKYCLAWNKWVHDLMRDYNLDINVTEKVFETPVDVCIERDAMRPADRRVGGKMIKDFYYKYVADVNPVKYNSGLPHAIICDIDGTVAIAKDRSHYDYSKVYHDLTNPQVIKIVEWYLSSDVNTVLFVSGRDDICEADTRKWLLEHIQMTNDEFLLLMRKTGDRRKDSIVKREIFETYIRGNWNIDFVLDDRNQVVEMWRRELGLTCLQVAEGDF